MLLLIFSFMCFVVTIVGAYRVVKSIRANDPEGSNKWLGVTIGFMLLSWVVKWVYELFHKDSDDSETSKAKYQYFILNEDYTYYEGTVAKASFKKGDVVRGIVSKADQNTGKLLTAAQSTAVQDNFLFLMSAKISIPTNKLRYPTETELKEIEADVTKFVDKIV